LCAPFLQERPAETDHFDGWCGYTERKEIFTGIIPRFERYFASLGVMVRAPGPGGRKVSTENILRKTAGTIQPQLLRLLVVFQQAAFQLHKFLEALLVLVC
jgi:hypothetical protein